ncbi:MAG: site-specific integrase [bacterium]|nr:site-specific integrase [bacterium]
MEKMNSLFVSIHNYLLVALPKERKSSENTIRSYKKSLELFLDFVKKRTGKPFTALSFDDIDRDTLSEFLEYLEKDRGCSISTRNRRLHCIRAFYRYASQEDISVVCHFNEIEKVKKAKQPQKLVEHMSEAAVQAIIAQPDTTTDNGKRDSFMMLFLYRTGIRVQELVDIKLSDIRLDSHPSLTVCGKGTKVRSIPLRADTVKQLKHYLEYFHHGESMYSNNYLFYTVRNRTRKRMTEDNVRCIIRKHGIAAKKVCLEVPDNVHPHLFRHSLAMSLYQNGVDLSLISQWLGHSCIETTLIYAHADTEIKRQTIERAVPEESTLKPFLNSDRYTINDEDLLKQLCGLK